MSQGINIPVKKEMVVIGTGMAGMAATLFATKRGIDTAQVGMAGQINFSSGLIDLMGVYPTAENRIWSDPWAAIAALKKTDINHPYAHLSKNQIQTAMSEFLDFLSSAGLRYHHKGQTNQQVITPIGTTKTTYAVPHTMAGGVKALDQKPPCLIIDVNGLKGFSGAQIVGQLKHKWPRLRTIRIALPHTKGELYPERIARSLEIKQNRRELADIIKPHIKDERIIGVPAILGIVRSADVIDDLTRWLDVEIFEIPTMMPAITGLRLREAFESRLPQMGVSTLYQQKVTKTYKRTEGGWRLTISGGTNPYDIDAKCVILASGRFLGRGLHADRTGIRETIFDLPVKQPADRDQWHQKDLLHPEGHPINRCGISIDRYFRPVGKKGKPVHSNLFAAGSVLANQDWVRQQCGSGLAIATAFAAVEAAQKHVLN